MTSLHRMLKLLERRFFWKYILWIFVILTQYKVLARNLTEIIAPHFLPSQKNVTFHVGELAKLPCSIVNLGKNRMVAWRKLPDVYPLTIGEMTYAPDKRIGIDHSFKRNNITDWTLLIKNVQPKHAGLYECQITSSASYIRHVQLNVIAIFLKGTQYVQRNEPIRLACSITGTNGPPEDVSWHKNGQKIDAAYESGLIITKYKALKDRTLVSELIIDKGTPRHSGTYMCQSSSHQSAEIDVYVLAAGAANVKRGTSSAHLAELAKKNDNSGAIHVVPSLGLSLCFVLQISLTLFTV